MPPKQPMTFQDLVDAVQRLQGLVLNQPRLHRKDLMARYGLCLCVFAGLRPSEAERVEWNDLNFEGKEIFVKDDGKTGLRRFVLKDAETIWIWLNHIKTTRPNEPLNPPSNHIGLQTQFRRDLGLSWTQDVLRHSFGTYYYNLTRDLTQVSHDMGNSIVICKRYYVREVKREWTNKFWGLRPKS
jgi:integrase